MRQASGVKGLVVAALSLIFLRRCPALKCRPFLRAGTANAHVKNLLWSIVQFVISLLMNEGDSVLVEKYTYSHLVDNVINFRGYACGSTHALLLVTHLYRPHVHRCKTHCRAFKDWRRSRLSCHDRQPQLLWPTCSLVILDLLVS